MIQACMYASETMHTRLYGKRNCLVWVST